MAAQAAKSGMGVGAKVAPKKRAAEGPTLWGVESVSEEWVTVQAMGLVKEKTQKKLAVQDFLTNWKVSTEKAPVELIDIQACVETVALNWCLMKAQVAHFQFYTPDFCVGFHFHQFPNVGYEVASSSLQACRGPPVPFDPRARPSSARPYSAPDP